VVGLKEMPVWPK